jgi:hypothetical protein
MVSNYKVEDDCGCRTVTAVTFGNCLMHAQHQGDFSSGIKGVDARPKP